MVSVHDWWLGAEMAQQGANEGKLLPSGQPGPRGTKEPRREIQASKSHLSELLLAKPHLLMASELHSHGPVTFPKALSMAYEALGGHFYLNHKRWAESPRMQCQRHKADIMD